MTLAEDDATRALSQARGAFRLLRWWLVAFALWHLVFFGSLAWNIIHK